MQQENTEPLDAFKHRLNALAESRRISQAEIARRLEVSPQRVGNWFQGRNFPQRGEDTRLAEILGANLVFLMEGRYSEAGDSNTAVMERGPLNFPRNNPPPTGKERGSSVLVNAAFAPPVPNPTPQDCIEYLRTYLAEAEHVSGAVAEAYRILKKRLDLDEIRADRAKQQT